MKRPLIAVAALACLSLLVAPGRTDEDPVDAFMRAKLTHSKEVLEGLTLEDFDQIAKHGQELSLLSQAAAWNVLQTPEYKQHSLEFRRSADSLTKAAKNKNLDGAALAYVDVTLKCVNCHKYVRGVRTAQRLPDAALQLSTQPPRSARVASEVLP